MVETLILTLVYIVVIVAAVWLVIWVLGMIGVPLPEMVVKCMWVIAVLLIILLLWRMLGPLLRLG
jgi:hypothetical protein